MSDDVRVIWKKGDGAMPEKVQHVVDTARGDLLLETLHLPESIENSNFTFNHELQERQPPRRFSAVCPTNLTNRLGNR